MCSPECLADEFNHVIQLIALSRGKAATSRTNSIQNLTGRTGDPVQATTPNDRDIPQSPQGIA